ncbi:RadB-like protein [Streptomyces phage Dagobah]|nr:RadB-like protein [Streptomyces phage Dagobah]
MTDEGQAGEPRFAQPPSLADIWGELPEEARMALYPLVKGAERNELNARIKEDFDSAAREEQLRQQAIDNLFYRDAKRATDQLERERSGAVNSWQRQKLGHLLDEEQQEPDIGELEEDGTSNGGALFYSGKVNEIHGPSESGKSMVLLAVAAQLIQAGRDVAMIDYEDDGKSVGLRLKWVFGLTVEEIDAHFHYLQPETQVCEETFAALRSVPDLAMCIVDAVTEAMSLEGLDGRAENDVAAWYNLLPKRIVSEVPGAAVVVVDHTPMGSPNRQIGSQHKKSGITGVSYTAEPVFPFTRGGKGMLRLKVAKDRPGGVRAAALPQGDGEQHWRADFTIDGTLIPSKPQVSLRGVDPAVTGHSKAPVQPDAAEDAVMDFEPLNDRQFLYLKSLSAAGRRGRNMTEMYQADDIPKSERPQRTTPRKVIVEQLEPKGYVEEVPQDKGRWRVTGKGVSKILQQEKDGLEKVRKWSESPSRRTGSTTGSEPVGEPVGEPVADLLEPVGEPVADLHEPV